MLFQGVNIGDKFLLGNRGISQVFPTFGDLFTTILFNVYGLAGIILLLLLIFGGFNVIIGAGNEKSDQIQKGQKALTYAIAGFGIIFASYFIIQIIEVITGVPILNSNL